MKRVLVIPFMLIMVLCIRAQMIISPYMPYDQEGMTQNNAKLLENRLGAIINDYGCLSAEGGRFILTMNWNVIDKEVIGSGPTVVMYKLEVGLYLGDGMTGNKFASTSFTLKGAGNNEAKAIINAMKGFGAHRSEIGSMIEKGTEQIIAYYEANKRNILTSARTMMSMHNYDEALFTLYQIPMQCSYYKEAQSMINQAYKGQVNTNAAEQLQRARAMWAASPSRENADMVMALVGDIDPSSSSFAGAQALIKEVKGRTTRLDNEDRAEWHRQAAHERSMDRARVQAVRDVCVAYAKSQPRVIYNIRTWW